LLRNIEQYGYFGERSVVNNEVRSASGVAVCPTECWVMSQETFNAVIDRQIVEILRQRMELQDDTI
jgi:CRP-like cAMP-binding protein